MADTSDEKIFLERWVRIVPGACLFTCPICNDEIILEVPIKAKLKKLPDGSAVLSFDVIQDGKTIVTLEEHVKEKHDG